MSKFIRKRQHKRVRKKGGKEETCSLLRKCHKKFSCCCKNFRDGILPELFQMKRLRLKKKKEPKKKCKPQSKVTKRPQQTPSTSPATPNIEKKLNQNTNFCRGIQPPAPCKPPQRPTYALLKLKKQYNIEENKKGHLDEGGGKEEREEEEGEGGWR